MTSRIFAASATLRQIGPVRMFSPAPIMPSRLTSSCVGASPTRLFTAAGHRIDTTVSSPIAQVTRLAATELAEPALDMPGSRSVSYGLQKVPPNELRAPSTAYSARFAFARMIAPASRNRRTNVASSGGRSFAYCASAPDVVRMSKVSYWSLMAMTTPWSGPTRLPVCLN